MDSEAESPPSVRKPKTLLDLTGGWGPVQMYVFACVLVSVSLLSWQSLAMNFLTPPVKHWCVSGTQDVQEENVNFYAPNPCQYSTNLSITSCSKWNYSHDEFHSTLTEKYSLVCENKWITPLLKSVFMFGGLFMNPIIGAMSDRYGRRTTALLSSIPAIVGSILILVSQNVEMIIAGQILNGISSGCTLNPVLVLMMELTEGNRRVQATVLIDLGFSSGAILLGLAAWAFRDWFYVQLLGLGLASLLLIMIWVLPESPSWLVLQGKTEEAFKNVRRIAKRNRKDYQKLDDDFIEASQLLQHKGSSRNALRDILTTWEGWRKTLLVMYSRLVAGILYYGIAMNIHVFGENLFTDFLVSVSLTIPVVLLVFLVLKRLSLIKTTVVCLALQALICLTYSIVSGLQVWVVGLHTALVVLAWMNCGPLIPLSIQLIGESYGPEVRGTFSGVGFFLSRIGGVVASYFGVMGETVNAYTPMLIFGLACLGSIVALLLLPNDSSKSVIPQVVEVHERSTTKDTSC